MTSLGLLEEFFRRARGAPDKSFLVSEEGSIDYGSAAREIARLSEVLRGGSRELTVLAENTPRFALFLAACTLARRTVHVFSKEDLREPVYRWLQSRNPSI